MQREGSRKTGNWGGGAQNGSDSSSDEEKEAAEYEDDDETVEVSEQTAFPQMSRLSTRLWNQIAAMSLAPQVAMNLDELVCGALESSFWAMDRQEIYNRQPFQADRHVCFPSRPVFVYTVPAPLSHSATCNE